MTSGALEQYCIVGRNGKPDQRKIDAVLSAISSHNPRESADLPDIRGIPRLTADVKSIADISGALERYLPVVEANPYLHALSFIDPLRLAVDHLGIRVSPEVASFVQRRMRGIVSFSEDGPSDRWIERARSMHWKLKQPDEKKARKQKRQK